MRVGCFEDVLLGLPRGAVLDAGAGLAAFVGLRCNLEALLDGLEGVRGAASRRVEARFGATCWDILFSASFEDRSTIVVIVELRVGSSSTGEIRAFSARFRVNIPRSPPFEPCLWSFNGTWESSLPVENCMVGGRDLLADAKVLLRACSPS